MEHLDHRFAVYVVCLALAFLIELAAVLVVVRAWPRLGSRSRALWLPALLGHAVVLLSSPFLTFLSARQDLTKFGAAQLAWLVLNSSGFASGATALAGSVVVFALVWGASGAVRPHPPDGR